VTEVGASLKTYNQHLAPLGGFFDLRLGLISQSFDPVDINFLTNVEFSDGSIFTMVQTRTIDGFTSLGLNLGMGWGVNRIVSDLVQITYGVQFNFAYFFDGSTKEILELSGSSRNFLNENDSEAVIQDKLSRKATVRTFGFNIFQFSIAVGILPEGNEKLWKTKKGSSMTSLFNIEAGATYLKKSFTMSLFTIFSS
jgi:hypothetical protein